MTTNEFLEPYQAFVRYLQVQGYTKQSIQAYTSALKPFLKYLIEKDIRSFPGVDSETMLAYQDYVHGDLRSMTGKPASAQYQRRLLTVVHILYAYLTESGVVKTDPTAGLVLPQLARRDPREALTAEELRALYKACDTTTTPGYRDRTLFELLSAAGLWKNEVMRLKVCDVDVERGEVLVERNGKRRTIPLAKETAEIVGTYLDTHRVRLMDPLEPDHEYLLANDKGRKITQVFYQTFLRKYAEKARIRKKMHIGMFRNTFAMRLLTSEVPLRRIQQILGSEGDESEETMNDLRYVIEKIYVREE